MENELDRRKLNDYFIEIIAHNLHQEECEKEGEALTAAQVMQRDNGWRVRLRNDSFFYHRVQLIVASLNRAVDVAHGGYDDLEAFVKAAQAMAGFTASEPTDSSPTPNTPAKPT